MCIVAALAVAQQDTIVNTKHNLSTSGPGPVQALSEDQVCIFCHTPHGARDVAPLWNRRDSTATYIPYDSPTLRASPGQPTGASKLCLSCHDGTIALGDLVSADSAIPMTGDGFMPAGGGLIGTDLRNDHPISFSYDEAQSESGGELVPAGSLDPAIHLDELGMLQCTSCHDPHDNQFGDFLVMDNREAALCRGCHAPFEFELSPHALSPATWSGAGEDPWPHTEYQNVRENSCLNCHQSHHAPGAVELLTDDLDEEVCYKCHDGSVAAEDIRAVFRKSYRHPVELFDGSHTPGESALEAAGHVECVDCHNPHRARDEAATAPLAPGAIRGVTGLDVNGNEVIEAEYEYEVCYKCHGNDDGAPLNTIRRLIPSVNVQQEFSPTSPSYHPVAAVGKAAFVPSLIPPLTVGSMIYCSDCHGNDDPGGPAGPHGSGREFLLKRRYDTGFAEETPAAYALCYGCHDRDSLLGDEGFEEHSRHIERASCSVCHDPHGIDYTEGSQTNNAHMINFDPAYVLPNNDGVLEYVSTGPGSGYCSLRCHNKNHRESDYP